MKVKHWGPRLEVIAYAESLVNAGAKVLEIGPGHIPFAKATHFVDRYPRPDVKGELHNVNVIRDPLPFADKIFDFVYCRHVVEDLVYPDLLLSEMNRVGRSGYIETPSPAAELTRGVDGSSPPYRGYVHHRWIVWAAEDTIRLIEKGNAIEHLDLSEMEKDSALDDAFAWNTYFFWEGGFEFKRLEHDVDFGLHHNYREMLLNAYAAGRRNAANTQRRVKAGR